MTADKGPEQEHFKANYIELIKRVVPEFYDEKEFELFGEEQDLQYLTLAKILYTATNFSSLVGRPLASSGTGGFSGHLAYIPYFVPFNQLSRTSPREYEEHVLRPLGKSYGSFSNFNEFSSFVATSALPTTQLNAVTTTFAQGYSSLTNPNASSVSAVEVELLDKLGWIYLLNTDGSIVDTDSVAPSSFVFSSIVNKLYYGNELTETDGVTNAFKWMWTNAKGGGAEWENVRGNFLPPPFTHTSATFSSNYYASGAQLASALDTLVQVWVNDNDPGTSYFKDIVDASRLGMNVTRRENRGPMGKMLKALSYAFYDVQDSIRDVQFLLDIKECPEEFLDYLARYLGWTFFTDDPDKWRDQLRQAIYLYKAKGTRQALITATNMVIPSGIYNPNAAVSGLQELWESYFPNLLYYVVKTETDLGTSLESYRNWGSAWNQSLAASGLNFRIDNYDPIEPDNNARFVVDYILKFLDYKHGYLNIAGKHYTDTFFWNSQTSAGGTPGYTYRGKKIPVPPWEEQRFYQNCNVTEPLVHTASAILADPIGNLGCGVSSTAALEFGRYVVSSIGLKDQNGFLEPGWGANNDFKFMSSSLNLPFNYKEVIRDGNLEGMSIFDYWNSKSSEVHSKFDLSSIDFSSNQLVNTTRTQMGRRGIPAFVEVCRQFAPLHVINKIFVGSSTYDNYGWTRHGTNVPFTPGASGVPWSGTLGTEILQTIQSDSDQINSSYQTSSFPGMHGTGIMSGISPGIYNPRQGRFIPSGVYGNRRTSYFFSGSTTPATDGISRGFKQVPNRPRTAGRRRSLKYKFTGWPNTRRGLNDPMNTDYFAASSTVATEGRQLYIPGFVPKGFNFSSQQFIDPSGSLSSVYSYYNTSATQFREFAGSSYFPFRAVPDFQTNLSSWNQLRDVFGSQILRAISDIFIRRGRVDSRWLQFTNLGYKNFKFGTGINKLYQEYNTVFNRALYNWISPMRQVKENRYGGGFNMLSHVFGPIMFNHDFTLNGPIINNLSKISFPGIEISGVSATNWDWSAVAAGGGIETDNALANTSGVRVDLTKGILQSNAYNTYIHPLDTFEHPSRIYYSNNSLVSGIEMVAPAGAVAFAALNKKGNASYNIDKISASGITLVQRGFLSNPSDSLRVRIPLDGNINYSYNGQFKFAPLDERSKANSSTSAIAGWGLYDQDRTPFINKLGTYHAAYMTADFVPSLTSALPHVVLTGRGSRTGTGATAYDDVVSGVLGVVNNPSLVSVTNHPDRATPKNLRELTPNYRYKLSLEASSQNHTSKPKMTYQVFNKTRSAQWVESAGIWKAADVSDLSANYCNVMVSSLFSPSGNNDFEWKNYKGYITPSSTFEEGDTYELWVTPANLDMASYAQFAVRNVKTSWVDASSTNTTWNGFAANRLFPNQEYKMGITARIAALVDGTPTDEELRVRVVVEQKPFVGNGWERNFARSWAYNWKSKFWEPTDTIPQAEEWKSCPLPIGAGLDSIESETRFDMAFTTYNFRTPLQYYSRSDGTMQGYFTSAGPLFDENTVYYIEIAKPTNTGEFNGVTLLGVDLVNKNYNIYAKDYVQKDFVDVFEFFDKLAVSKSSRDAVDSSGTYLLSGGARTEYMEAFGGQYSATNGFYRFVEND